MHRKKSMEEETRKLTLAVISMAIVVLVLFGLGPLV